MFAAPRRVLSEVVLPVRSTAGQLCFKKSASLKAVAPRSGRVHCPH